MQSVLAGFVLLLYKLLNSLDIFPFSGNSTISRFLSANARTSDCSRSRWAKSGVFERIFKLLASDHDNEYMMIDATIVRAHQHSAGARKKTVRKRSADRAAD